VPLLARLFRNVPSGQQPQGSDKLEEDEDVEVDDVEALSELGGTTSALKDVSFSVGVGKTLAVLGSSGAGKTTLLRVLAGVTPPTAGRVVIAGRRAPFHEFVAPLVEPERTPAQAAILTGRLGDYKRREVKRHLETIFEFAGISSSARRGAVGKLARQVAISTCLHLDASIIFLDEPSSLGDIRFQERCFQLLAERRAMGVTLVIATRDPASVRGLCEDAIWLDNGSVRSSGPFDTVAKSGTAAREIALGDEELPDPLDPTIPAAERSFNKSVSIIGARVAEAGETEILERNESLVIEVDLELAGAPIGVRCGVGFSTEDPVGVWTSQPTPILYRATGHQHLTVTVPRDVLPGGRVSARIEIIVRRDGADSSIGRDGAFTLEIDEPREREPAFERNSVSRKFGKEWVRTASIWRTDPPPRGWL
jgi:ABC-type polysaccharide/polyol phosphate transport system ATPase subunit